MSNFEDVMKKAVEDGYISPDGCPLKCWKCESRDLEFTNHYDDIILVEVSVICNNCKTDVGLWSYGSWVV